jgi:hypothetical protein
LPFPVESTQSPTLTPPTPAPVAPPSAQTRESHEALQPQPQLTDEQASEIAEEAFEAITQPQEEVSLGY